MSHTGRGAPCGAPLQTSLDHRAAVVAGQGTRSGGQATDLVAEADALLWRLTLDPVVASYEAGYRQALVDVAGRHVELTEAWVPAGRARHAEMVAERLAAMDAAAAAGPRQRDDHRARLAEHDARLLRAAGLFDLADRLDRRAADLRAADLRAADPRTGLDGYRERAA